MRRFLTGTMVHQGSPWFTMVHPKNSENCCLTGLTMFQLHPGGPLPLILAYQASAAQRRRDRQMQCIRDIQVAQNVIQHLTRHDSTWLDMTRHVASCESHMMNIFAPSLQLQHLKISQVESQAKCLQFYMFYEYCLSESISLKILEVKTTWEFLGFEVWREATRLYRAWSSGLSADGVDLLFNNTSPTLTLSEPEIHAG